MTIKYKQNQGFGLIELLVTVSIISVLVGIAIPQYQNARRTAFDTKAKEDLINASRAEEAYYADTLTYKSCVDSGCNAIPGINSLSTGVTLRIDATASSFTGTASHPAGSGAVFTWDSQNGGLQ